MFYILCIQLVASAGHVALVLCGHVETSVSPNEQLCSAHAGAEQSAWEGGPPVVSYSSPGVMTAFLMALVVRYRRMDDSL